MKAKFKVSKVMKNAWKDLSSVEYVIFNQTRKKPFFNVFKVVENSLLLFIKKHRKERK